MSPISYLSTNTNLSIPEKKDLILKNGTPFLDQTKRKLDALTNLWDAAKNSDSYSNQAKMASERVKSFAKESKQLMERLNQEALVLLDIEFSKTPYSEESYKLQKITALSSLGINYMTSIIENSHYPTFSNQTLTFLRNSLIYTTCAVYGLVITDFLLADKYSRIELNPYLTKAGGISLLSTVWFCVLQGCCYYKNQDKIDNAKHLFEKNLKTETKK